MRTDITAIADYRARIDHGRVVPTRYKRVGIVKKRCDTCEDQCWVTGNQGIAAIADSQIFAHHKRTCPAALCGRAISGVRYKAKADRVAGIQGADTTHYK